MLTSLSIRNFGIIEDLCIDFTQGLNILTGETGAGKSILIDALRFSLGERFQSSHMRDKAQQCDVEAVFCLEPSFLKAHACFEDFINASNEIIIQRSAFLDGRNKIKINGFSVTVAQLKQIGDLLIDLHGPHDHQQLLAEQQHTYIIDALTDFADVFKQYTQTYREYLTLQSSLRTLEDLASSRERDLDLLEHQIKELEQVPLDEEHFNDIEQQRLKIHHAEKLYQHIQTALNILENTEAPINTLISKTFKPLTQLSSIDEKASSFIDQLSLIETNTQELLSHLKRYGDSLSFNQEDASFIHQQVDAYINIKRKFGPTLTDAKNFYEKAKEKLSSLKSFDQHHDDLVEKITSTKKSLTILGKNIADQRLKTAKTLKKTIEKELHELGFKSIIFETTFEKTEFSPLGNQKAVFYISTNAGESLKPLADIISSGEAARLMLAIKRALMKVDTVPVLIFDEIDAQIGGRLGTIIGKKLKEIADYRQILLITHLPQIAAFAKNHLKISKLIENHRTKTIVTPLKKDARIQELAEMMTGEATTSTAIKHAKELLNNII